MGWNGEAEVVRLGHMTLHSIIWMYRVCFTSSDPFLRWAYRIMESLSFTSATSYFLAIADSPWDSRNFYKVQPLPSRSLNLNLTILSEYALLLCDPKSLITSALVCWEFCDALENQKGSEGNWSSCHVSIPLGSPWGNLPYQGLSLGWSVVRMERKGVFSFNSRGSSSLVQNCKNKRV